MSLLKLLVVALLTGGLFGGGFVAAKKFAEWIFKNEGPTDPPAFV